VLQQVSGLFVQCCLHNGCEHRFKTQLIANLHQQLTCYQKLSHFDSDPFTTCLQTVVPEILKGLEQSESKETLMGAIALCECIFNVLDQSSFEQAFGTITNKLRGAADI